MSGTEGKDTKLSPETMFQVNQAISAASAYLAFKGLDQQSTASIMGVIITAVNTAVGSYVANQIVMLDQYQHVWMSILTGVLDGVVKKFTVQTKMTLYDNITESISISTVQHIASSQFAKLPGKYDAMQKQ